MTQTKVELIDLNGKELVLDADADTSITADTDDVVHVKTGGTDRLTVQSTAGNNVVIADGLTLTDGDVTVASGHGINFAATGDGSGTDSSELLDDYEEGTWTPSITAGFYAQNGYQTLHGRYIKTGSQVHVSFYYYTAASGWTSNGLAIQLGNLPYTQVNETGARGLGVVGYTNMAAYTPAIYGNPNSATVTLYRDGSTGFARGSNHTAGNSLYIIGGFSYEAA